MPKSEDAIMAAPWKLGGLTIPNRLVRSATLECLSNRDGSPTPRLTDVLVDLARGGVGLIIAGTAYISREGQGEKNGTGLHEDRLIPSLGRLCESVAGAGGILAAQIIHCGSTLEPAAMKEKEKIYGPSAGIDPVNGARVTELSRAHIRRITDDFHAAASRAKRAGFRAVQIHAAHGYLLNQFLSPSRNRREDEYGGSLENRARFLYQVLEAVRDAVGPGFPVMVKMSGHDGFEGGVAPDEAVEVAAALDAMGIDAIEVSGGTPEGEAKGGWDHIRPAPFREGALFDYAAMIKARVGCPVISVEGWRTPDAVCRALKTIDAVSMSRPFIREPDLAGRWLGGDSAPARCVSCNKCLEILADKGLGCVFRQKTMA